MAEEDVYQCLEIFHQHGLATSAHGLKTFRKIEPEGCYVLTPGDNDSEIIAFTACSRYDPRVTVVSFYGTKLGFQGIGLGSKVWKEMMKFLSDTDNIGLSAAPNEVQMYQDKVGLKVIDKHQMVVLDKTGPTDPEAIKPTKEESSQVKLIQLEDADWRQLMKYDKHVVGFDRSVLLKMSLNEADTVCLVSFDPIHDIITGYGAIKPTNETGKNKAFLGPLYANNPVIAKVLMYNLLISFPRSIEKGFITFAIDSNLDAISFSKQVGLINTMTCPKLYSKQVLCGVDYRKVYNLLSPGFSFY